MGAAQQPSVAVQEPSRNQRVMKFRALHSAARALAVNLLKIKERQKPQLLKKKILASFSARSLVTILETYSSDPTPTNDLRPPETGAVICFVTFPRRNLTMGLRPIR
jgi:hypothetical protein